MVEVLKIAWCARILSLTAFNVILKKQRKSQKINYGILSKFHNIWIDGYILYKQIHFRSENT
jgi:hypothetical protein